MKTPKTLLAITAALAMLPLAAQAAEFRSADTHNADDYPTVAAVKYMSELLDKKSGGKHKIKVFNKQALGSEKETIDQVKIGALDFTRVNVGPMNAICPLTQVPTMPFLFSSIAHMRKSLDGPVGDEILKSCESAGFVGLAFYDSGARSIYAKKPIKTVADAKGLKIRVQQSDLWVALVSAMGANATPMPYGEVYTGLKSGLVDFDNFGTSGFYVDERFGFLLVPLLALERDRFFGHSADHVLLGFGQLVEDDFGHHQNLGRHRMLGL